MSRILVERGANPRRRRLVLGKRNVCCHIVSRAPFGHFFMESDAVREMFVKMLVKQAGFCGVELLAYCVMSNHIHLLVRIPYLSPEKQTDEQLLRRYEFLYGSNYVPESSFTLSEVKSILSEGGTLAESLRTALWARMGNVSVFMRELKQRFALWYNNSFENKGTVWSGRFKSQIIQDNPTFLQMVAAYIDLNPVRAGIVSRPEEYGFSSVAAAIRGNAFARSGYQRIFQANDDASLENYLQFLHAKGANAKSLAALYWKRGSGSIPRQNQDVLKLPKDDSSISKRSHSRFRHLIDGGALGQTSFVEQVFSENRDAFSENRKDGAREISGFDTSHDIRVLRSLKD